MAAAVQRLLEETLSPETLILLSGPVGKAMAQAVSYASRAPSDNTRRAYNSDRRVFLGLNWSSQHLFALIAAPHQELRLVSSSRASCAVSR